MSKSFITWAVLAQGFSISTAIAAADEPSLTWLPIPWEIRYLLFVDTAAGRAQDFQLAKHNNAADGRNGKHYVYLDVDELLTERSIFSMPNSPAIATSLLSFDKKGNVVTNNKRLHGYTGKFSALDHLILMREDAPNAKPYHMLHWSQGIPGNLSFGPSPCTLLDQRRYQDDWESGAYPGDFGCREWTAQLFDDERPYIDVTTYTKRGNFIGEFVGWSRFKDAPKPVIGMNGKTWLCLHECPDEQRGIIPDIKAWTIRHGYPMPVAPPYQPEYPNRNYKDDFSEVNNE